MSIYECCPLYSKLCVSCNDDYDYLASSPTEIKCVQC